MTNGIKIGVREQSSTANETQQFGELREAIAKNLDSCIKGTRHDTKYIRMSLDTAKAVFPLFADSAEGEYEAYNFSLIRLTTGPLMIRVYNETVHLEYQSLTVTFHAQDAQEVASMFKAIRDKR